MSVSPVLDPALDSTLGASTTAAPAAPSEKRWDPRDVDWGAVKDQALTIARHPLFVPGVLAFVGLVLAFLPLILALPTRWNQDQYYSHGWLVPALCGFIIFRRWPKIQAMAGGRAIETPHHKLAIKIVAGVGAVLWTWVLGAAAYRSLGYVLAFSNGVAMGAALLLVMTVVFAGAYGLGIALVNRLAGFQATALAVIVALLPLVYASYVGDIIALQSILFVAVAILAVALVGGWKWALALTPGIAFLMFGLPVWNSFIDGYTNPLQLASTTVAFQLLQAFGYSTYQQDPTTLVVGSFMLNVEIPCSGMKLLLAVSAFTTLFVLIANLRFWSNIAMFALIVPLCLFINGLRIALIGVVGAEQGTAAAMEFHDKSGYITLVVCFFLLFKFARLLGWKN